MASRHTGPASRSVLPLLPVLLAAVLLAACGGSSGVHTQTPTSAPAVADRVVAERPVDFVVDEHIIEHSDELDSNDPDAECHPGRARRG